jgi:catechol 2,3-dioxygenase-like lactoylglutathione lyase family enzyme
MQTGLNHLLIGVKPVNLGFYKDLFGFLGWNTIYDGDGMLGLSGKGETSLWFGTEVKAVANDYDGPGVNHLGIGAESIADVDATCAYLKEHRVPALFETPRHRPEFSEEGKTYYQVMFESPDKILFEVVYVGPK